MKQILLMIAVVVLVGCGKGKGADNSPALLGVYKHDSSNVDDPTRSLANPLIGMVFLWNSILSKQQIKP